MFKKRSSPDPSAPAATHPGGLTRDHVVWAYRLLLDREPESDDVIAPKLAGSQDTADLRRHLMTSAEFQTKNPDYAHSNDRAVVIKEIDTDLRLFVDLSDHAIGLNIVRGRYEEDGIRFVRSVLRSGDNAVDAGAHIGFFTMHMASVVGERGHVHAFEPFDGNADLLERSIAENRFAGRVVFQRAAVGERSTTATLTFPDETLNTGGAYLLPQGAAPLSGNRTRQVPVVALDEMGLARPIRLIKMDVEGAEPLVVKGASKILVVDRPTILSELHPVQLQRASTVSGNEFLAQMTALGYHAHLLEDGAIGTRIERAPEEAIVSVVFVPK